MDYLPVGPNATEPGWHSSPVWSAFWLVGESGTNGVFNAYEGFNPNYFAFVTLINRLRGSGETAHISTTSQAIIMMGP
uniref:Uncharacterized protein n=1 Tax=Acrobeloides nanus TaxID=290746 RepID=A0A914DXD6_9BILA